MIRRIAGNRAVQIVAVIVVLAAALVAWLAYSALKVKGDLESVRTDASKARTLMLDGDQAGASQAAAAAADSAQAASDRSHGIIWSAVAAIPGIGSPLESVQQMSDAVEALSADVLLPAADLAGVLNPDRLRTGNTVNLKLLREAQPDLSKVAARSTEVAGEVAAIDPSSARRGRRRENPTRRTGRRSRVHPGRHRHRREAHPADAGFVGAAQLLPGLPDAVGSPRNRRPGTAVSACSTRPGGA